MADRNAIAPSQVKRSNRAAWSGRASLYQEHHGQMSVEAVGPLLNAVGLAEGGAGTGGEFRLLDVGTGPGFGAGEAVRRGAWTVGLDLAPAMVTLAAGNVPGAAFVQADGENLPLADGAFDAVISCFAMPQMPDPSRAVAEAYRVLAPGGRYGIALRSGAAEDANKQLVAAAVATHGDGRAAVSASEDGGLRDPAAYADLLDRAGFIAISRAELPIVWRPADTRELLAAINSGSRSSRLLDSQTPAARQRIERAVAAAAARFRTEAGYAIPRLALILSARKP